MTTLLGHVAFGMAWCAWHLSGGMLMRWICWWVETCQILWLFSVTDVNWSSVICMILNFPLFPPGELAHTSSFLSNSQGPHTWDWSYRVWVIQGPPRHHATETANWTGLQLVDFPRSAFSLVHFDFCHLHTLYSSINLPDRESRLKTGQLEGKWQVLQNTHDIYLIRERKLRRHIS